MNSNRFLPGDPPRWLPWAIALGLIVAGALIPLSDPDLPAHLAFGEWIVRHHAVPFTEPFAWTRSGAPYYAYSWLAQTTYYVVLRAFGPMGLELLHGAVLAAAFLAVYPLGRARRWRPWATLAVAIGNTWMLLGFATFLRPQALLLVLVPLAWAFGYRILDGERRWWIAVVGLYAVSAVAANTHLFFVVTALPWWLLLARPLPRSRDARIRAIALLLAPIAGWVSTPYAFVWPAAFRLFFTPNPIMRWPSPIGELQPGVIGVAHAPDLAVGVLILLTLPWLVTRPASGVPSRERVVFAVLWTLGLVSFAAAGRLAIVWWLASLPWLGVSFSVIPDATTAGTRIARIVTAIIIVLAPAVGNARRPPAGTPPARGVTPPRTLPVYGDATQVEPLAQWLDAHAPQRHGRIMTTFNFGSYLLWRLPSYSMSIDSRGIFPDSVLTPESFLLAGNGKRPLGPWRSADIVIIPRNYELASVLDTAQGWAHVANAPAHDPKPRTSRDTMPPGTPGLWVRTRWLNGGGSTQ